MLASLSAGVLQLVTVAARGALELTVALFGLYFMLVSGPAAWRHVLEYLPFSSESAEQMRGRFVRVTEAMLLGIAATAALQGVVVGIGFWATGLPDAPFWAVVTAIASILPVLGSALVWAPGAAALALGGRYGAATALALLGLVVASNIDNVMRPLVYRRVSHIHPMTTVLGAFAGVALFGISGVLLGPLAITYFFELVAIYRREYGAGGPSARSERGAEAEDVPVGIADPEVAEPVRTIRQR